jgi:lipopolysaccharide transport system ATP-binding protein
VLFVSHNMAVIQGLCTSAILLDKGRVVQQGEVGRVVAAYVQKKKEVDDPTEILARSKDGTLELVTVRLTDSAGNLLQGIQCGDTIRFEILVRSSVERRTATAAVGINDAYGRRIAVLHSGLYGFSSPLRIGLQSFVCQINRMPLSPGEYRLDLHLFGGRGGLASGPLIHAPNSASLDVVPGDYHGTGQLPPDSWGGVVQLPQQWSYIQKPTEGTDPLEAAAAKPLSDGV